MHCDNDFPKAGSYKEADWGKLVAMAPTRNGNTRSKRKPMPTPGPLEWLREWGPQVFQSKEKGAVDPRTDKTWVEPE